MFTYGHKQLELELGQQQGKMIGVKLSNYDITVINDLEIFKYISFTVRIQEKVPIFK